LHCNWIDSIGGYHIVIVDFCSRCFYKCFCDLFLNRDESCNVVQRFGEKKEAMKKIGIVLILVSFIVGFLSDSLPKGFPIEPIVMLAFGYFLLGIYLLIKSK
jgi:hypothetical protein